MGNKKYFSTALKCLFVSLMLLLVSVYAVSSASAQELIGDGLVCFIDFSRPNQRSTVCQPGTNFTLRYSILKSRLLEGTQVFPVSWINMCENDTQMLRYRITASNSELLTQGFRFEPLSSGRPAVFPSGTTTSNLLRFTVTAPPEIEIEARVHRITLTVDRAGTTPPVSTFHFELEVIDDMPVTGDLTLLAIQRGVEHLGPTQAFADNLIFSFDEGGYRNASGEVLTERHIAPLFVEPSFRRSGITVDGNTRLLLVAQLNMDSMPEGLNVENLSATFSVNSINASANNMRLESLSRRQRANRDITIRMEPVEENIFQATAVLIAPEYMTEFNNWGTWFATTVSVTGLEGVEVPSLRTTFGLYQPPVVLIHGLWSNNRTWGYERAGASGGILQQLMSRGYVVQLYEYPGTDGPLVHMARGQRSLYDMTVNALREQIRRFNTASSQVDLVVHSMGGLMARRFMYDNNYYLSREHNAFNYQSGSIRRLVTIGTPHNGSPLADFLVRRPQFFPPSVLPFNIVNDTRHQMGYDHITWLIHEPRGPKLVFATEGDANLPAWQRKINLAVEDLATHGSNNFIRNLNRVAPLPPVPMHTIAGDADGHFVATIGRGLASGLFTGLVHTYFSIPINVVHDIAFGGPSDAIVSVASAHFNNTNARARSTFGPHRHFDHVKQTRDIEIAAKIVEVLTSGLDVFSTPSTRNSPGRHSVFSDLTPQTFSMGGAGPRNTTRTLSTEHEIQLTSSHATATTGDTVTFTLTLPASFATDNILLAEIRIVDPFENSSEYEMTRVSDFVYEFSYTISGRTSGNLVVRAEVYTKDDNGYPEGFFRAIIVDLPIIPRMNTLWGMIVAPAHHSQIIMTAGTERQINVIGAFDDGFDRFINEGFMGTTYEITGNQGIATVSEDGRIRAIKPGEGTLIVRNGDISATASIEIFQSAAYWFVESIPDPEVDLDTGGNDTDGNSGDDSEGRRRNRRRYGCNTIAGGALMFLVLFPLLKKKK